MNVPVMISVVYLALVVVLALLLGLPGHRKRKRQKKELLSRLEKFR